MSPLLPSSQLPKPWTSNPSNDNKLAPVGQNFTLKKMNQAAGALSRLFPGKKNG